MSNNENSSGDISPTDRPRRGSFTSQAFNNIFGRSNSTSGPTAPFPGPISTATAQDQRRRMSISTLGLSGTSPSQASPFPFAARRASVSTAGSESIDENAIDDDDGPLGRSQPTTPFARRMSFGAQALRTVRGGNGNSPGSTGRTSSYTTSTPLPPIPAGGRGERKDSQTQAQASMQSKPRTASDLSFARPGEGGGFNWSEQLRSRAESTVSSQQRPNLSTSPNNGKAPQVLMHERAKSVSEMPVPPSSIAPPAPARQAKKPDAFQERILKGDFYMD
ncbi:hypothetical protein BP5796_10686 [Coleophoma crateriformis]|uniref:Uncharacterized protein n=1 Tax=Coleophoma crateriformis TaxID=565419 RepID=A0A3D8QRQ6_9HELO|nr:hypothetical protein BP5796_10686 [Coleophoma crateriformis]